MCGSFTQPGDIDIVRGFRAQYGVEVSDGPGDAAPPLQRERTATPFHDVKVIFADSDGVNRLGAIYWQLIHHWNREFRSKYTALNTRVESLDKRHNEPLLRRRRCILPVAAFLKPARSVVSRSSQRNPTSSRCREEGLWRSAASTRFG